MKAIVVTEEGTFAEYEDGLVPMPPRPSPAHTWDQAARRYVFNAEAAATQARERRDALIAQTDWTQANDIPLATQMIWRPYRQALRDLTDQPGFPGSISWPEPPQQAAAQQRTGAIL